MPIDAAGPLIAAACLTLGLGLAPPARAQSLTFGEVLAQGAVPLNADQAQTLARGARVRYTPLIGGTFRRWQLLPDGALTATRMGTSGAYFDAPGTWSVRPDGALCITIDWAILSTERWCRHIYPVDEVHYIFGRLAGPETPGATYHFSR